jgi:hypothetical protein
MERRDHEHAGFSWYLTNKPGIYNPYNVSDRISRRTWYDNITYPDMARSAKPAKLLKVSDIVHCGPHNLFTRLSCPKCNQR